MAFKDKIRNNLFNLKGWKTNKKIVVIESDDWGSIRTSSVCAQDFLRSKGISIENSPYLKNDSLASEEDLSHLFELLSEFKDKNGRHPVITANTVVANPDFQKIEASDFTEYYYEPFTETLKRYPDHNGAFELWKEGMNKNVFHPQFHGREHVNVPLWMKEINDDRSLFKKLFPYEMWGVDGKNAIKYGIHIQASFDTNDSAAINEQKNVLKEGLALFKHIFSFKSKSFIPNNYIYHSELENSLKEEGIKYIQGRTYHKYPRLGKNKRKILRHYTGQQNKLNQYYLVRNCDFEPSQMPPYHNSVDSCLNAISNAFFWKTPAIINAHRLNFIGYLNPENREINLCLLKDLLSEIIRKWPEVEFMTSDELGDKIFNN